MGWLIWTLGVLVVFIVPLWRICGRAGFTPALSLLVLIPVLGFLLLSAVLGLAEWPNAQHRPESEGG